MKRPSFQFYPSDWLSDPEISQLSLEEQGGFFRLLCFMWSTEDCTLTADIDVLSRLSGLSSPLVEKLVKIFNVSDGKITYQKFQDERKKQDDWREKCRKGGRRSAKSRLKGSSRVVQLKPNTSSPSPSSSSTSVIEENNKTGVPVLFQKKEKSEKENSENTPKENMQNFCLMVSEKTGRYLLFSQKISDAKKLPFEIVCGEIDKFFSYWTERTRDGTKMRWELEKTFEVQKRLNTWFLNLKKFNKPPSYAPITGIAKIR
jgi:uncharacterized protein YdaU (DUF1376 family)